jgi:hypothetical protein
MKFRIDLRIHHDVLVDGRLILVREDGAEDIAGILSMKAHEWGQFAAILPDSIPIVIRQEEKPRA